MKIAIVEDQLNEQNLLKKYISDYCDQHHLTSSIQCFNDGIDIASDYTAIYDVIYLDVEMEILDGMSTAKKIREQDKDVLIVFVTNHAQVAIQGYSVEAIDFLLKPLNAFVFEEHFKKIIRKLPSEEKEKLLYIKSKGKTIRINQKDIIYIENEGHYIHIHTNKGTHVTINSMKNMENLLDKKLFARSNNCYIINLSFVDRVEKNISYVNGQALQISRPRKKSFMDSLTNFIGEELL